MSTLVQLGRAPVGDRKTPPAGGGARWFWAILAIAIIALVAVAASVLNMPQAGGPLRENKAVPATAAVTDVKHPPLPGVTMPTLTVAAGERPRVARPDAPKEAPQPLASAINADERKRMEKELLHNESLPPEDRRPLAPTAAMIQTLDTERAILQ